MNEAVLKTKLGCIDSEEKNRINKQEMLTTKTALVTVSRIFENYEMRLVWTTTKEERPMILLRMIKGHPLVQVFISNHITCKYIDQLCCTLS